MKKRDNFTTLGHYGGVSVTYISKLKRFRGNIKQWVYARFI